MSDEATSFTAWVLAGLGGIVSTLAATVAFLFKLRENENSKNIAEIKAEHNKTVLEIKAELSQTSAKSAECEKDRAKLSTECALMAQKLDNLEHKVSQIDITGTKYSQNGHPQEKKA